MKRLLIAIFMVGCALPLMAQNGWTPVSKEQAERNAIMVQVTRINEQFTAMSAYNSSARTGQIFQLLKNIGTPVSYKILQELAASGQLPNSYLTVA